MSFRFMGGPPYRVAKQPQLVIGYWLLVIAFHKVNSIEALGIAEVSQMVLFTCIFKLL